MASTSRQERPSDPTTQTKNQDSGGDRIRSTIVAAVDSLNRDIGLDLRIPEETLAPRRRHEISEIASSIYSELLYQCHQGDLGAVLGDFYKKAKNCLSDWVKKSRADSSTLSSSTVPYRARNLTERQELQLLLRDTLVQSRKTAPPAKRRFTKSYSDGAVLAGTRRHGASLLDTTSAPVSAPVLAPVLASTHKPQGPSSRRWPKRPSEEGLDDEACKRLRQAPYLPLKQAASDLDSVDVRSSLRLKKTPASIAQVTASSAPLTSHTFPPPTRSPAPDTKLEHQPRQNPRLQRSFSVPYSPSLSNTSHVSLASAVFSTQDDEAPSNTQTTVEAPTQAPERKNIQAAVAQHRQLQAQSEARPPKAARAANPNTDAENEPTSSELEAYYEAHVQLEASPKLSAVPTHKEVVVRSAVPRTSSSMGSDDVSSSFPDVIDYRTLEKQRAKTEFVNPEQPKRGETLEERLLMVWPKFPVWLHDAPLAVSWEVSRVALHCDVDLSEMDMQYDPEWTDYSKLRLALYKRVEFSGRPFPERPDDAAWAASVDGGFRCRNQAVILSASMDFSGSTSGPFFILRLQPLRLEQGSRLSRRFGSDRFLEVLYPCPTSDSAPPELKGNELALRTVNRWLAREHHGLAGRQWAAFYTKDAGYKQPAMDVRLGPEPKPVIKERTYFFAEDGVDFVTTDAPRAIVPPKDGLVNKRIKLGVSQMLDWLLGLRENQDQPYLKLFSRVALGLSKTYPVLVFERQQIRRRADLVSPDGKNVMNDGVGRMSRSVAKKIKDSLGLADIPCAVQGRLGSAKGMWIIDVNDNGQEDWIETYPSQQKWRCDDTDPDQRTLEVRDHTGQLRSARLNMQFLPVLEDRSRDKGAMRAAMGNLLATDLQAELDSQRVAMRHPTEFRNWVHKNSWNRHMRVTHGHIPYLAGLPDKDEEVMNVMLDAGFDPMKQKYLQEIAWKVQKQKCDMLKKKLNICVGRSAYAYMVVDFWGILKEDEVHLCFSSKFQVDDWSDTLLDGVEVLVARSPAHYVSDVQKVKAVFKSELKDLKDVIVFPRTGNVALADKLSGGDYDGDLAWVCWDPMIVNNFVNAEVPQAPDLFEMGYLRKVKGKMGDLLVENCGNLPDATTSMIELSLLFNMRQNYLGMATNFKEKFCYKRNNVHDEQAVLLSTLLSNLVDQAKQGIEFSADEWRRLRRNLGERVEMAQPRYKDDSWGGVGEPSHIIDYLKFSVAKPLIEKELARFSAAMNPTSASLAPGAGPGADERVQYWDKDLAAHYDAFKALVQGSVGTTKLLDGLVRDIHVVATDWTTTMAVRAKKGDAAAAAVGYTSQVQRIYESWCAIRPDVSSHRQLANSKTVALLVQSWLPDQELGQWAILRASTTFKLYYQRSPNFVWRMAGRQLALIKWQMSSGGGGGGVPAVVVPSLHAMLKPDAKLIRQTVARMEGTDSQYDGGGVGGDDDSDGGGERGDDGDDWGDVDWR